MMRRWPPDRIAVGCKSRGRQEFRKTVILLDDETHADVRNGAIAAQCSFAAQARMLIEIGLETLKLEQAA